MYNLVHPTGDQELDVRRWERIAWLHYLRMSRSLADTPVARADLARRRVDAARVEFARAYRALGKVSP